MNEFIERVIVQLFAVFMYSTIHNFWGLGMTESILAVILWELLNIGYTLTKIRQKGIPRAKDKYYEEE
jgi:hypothetical protein